MRVIDAHLHLDPDAGDAQAAVRRLDADLGAAQITAGVLLHLDFHPWSMEEVAGALEESTRLMGFVNVRPGEGAIEQLKTAVGLGYRGLKLHPRLQSYAVDGEATVELVQVAGDLGLPVVVDAFPDGSWLLDGFDPRAFGRLGQLCPSARVVVAHFGGHHCIDVMMIAKRVPNLWIDLSYSLLYYRTSSVIADLVYACRSLRFERVMYGSDHPDRPVKDTLEASLEVLDEHGVRGDDLDRLMYTNAKELLGWPDD